MGKLLRLTNELTSKPQLMHPVALNSVIDYLSSRNTGEIELAVTGGKKREAKELCYMPETGVGVLSIEGPLTYLEYEPMCGAEPASYQRLSSEFQALVAAGAKTIVLDVDSPGGEAYACFETAVSLRKMADEAGVKILAYVDGMAASAAYGLACIADEIIVNPMAEVGSIGVVVGLLNTSEAEKKFGIERVYVYAGESKIPFDANGKFTKSFLEDIQLKVDTLYGEFVSHVAEARNIDPEKVKATQAKVFTSKLAVELGLADKIMTIDEFHTYLSDEANTNNGANMSVSKNRLFSLSLKGTDDMTKVAELEAQVASLSAQLEELGNVQAALETLTSENEVLAAALASAEDAKTTLEASLTAFQAAAEEAQAEAAKLAAEARKASLTAVVGEERAEELYTSLEALDDTAFASVVSAFAAARQAVDESVLMTELGVGADGKVATNDGLSLVGQLIKQKQTK